MMPPSLLSSKLRSSRLPDPLNHDCVGPYGLNREAESSSRGLSLECIRGRCGDFFRRATR
jgi:hypothetical protein